MVRPVPDNPTVHPDSPLIVSHLLDYGSAVIAWKSWTVAVFPAPSWTPRRSVQITNHHFGNADWLDDVPIPVGARPDPSDDGHMTVVGQGCAWDWYETDLSDPLHPKAGWIGRMRLDEDGVYDRGASSRGSGFANLAGVMWPQELASGEIDHALAFNYGTNRAGGPVWPATESDGFSNASWAIPEGARLYLPRTFDLSGYAPWVQTIGRAMQDYGLYDVDNGGASPLGLYAVNPTGHPEFPPYPWGSTSWPTLPDSLIRGLKVEQWGPQTASQYVPVASSCGSYR